MLRVLQSYGGDLNPVPLRKSKQQPRNLFVDDMMIKCNEKGMVREEDEGTFTIDG